jgi:hypothetical protein
MIMTITIAYSGIRCHVPWQIGTDISEECSAFIFMIENGGKERW